jgi:hypothetical protein
MRSIEPGISIRKAHRRPGLVPGLSFRSSGNYRRHHPRKPVIQYAAAFQ